MGSEIFISDLRRIFGDTHVITNEKIRKEFSLDKCPGNLLVENKKMCLAVVRPTGDKYKKQLVEFLKLARQCGKKIVVRGGGSGVCGAAVPRDAENTLIVDMTALNKIYELNPAGGFVVTGSGIMGHILEEIVNKYADHTIGHSPASLSISTPGGWIATCSSGQFSSRYGTIEDLILGTEVIIADGQIKWIEGNELKSFFGMEGGNAIITRVKMKIFSNLKHRKFLTLSFGNLEGALAALKSLIFLGQNLEQKSVYIKSARLYDWIDYRFISKPYKADENEEKISRRIKREKNILSFSAILNFGLAILEKAGMLKYTMILVLESDNKAVLDEESNRTLSLLTVYKSKAGDEKIAETWYENRYKLNYDKLIKRFKDGIIVDTFDCRPKYFKSSDASYLIDIYRKVKKSLTGLAMCGAHFGIDRDGPYIYFTLAAKNHCKDGVEFYRKIWKKILIACIDSGGLTTHHHGVGFLKAGPDNSLVPHAYGKEWYEKIAVPAKWRYDPENLFNPGNLF